MVFKGTDTAGGMKPLLKFLNAKANPAAISRDALEPLAATSSVTRFSNMLSRFDINPLALI